MAAWSLNAQQSSEKMEISPAKEDVKQNKFGGEMISLDALPDPTIVFADSNFRFSLNHFALQQVLTPFPIQVNSNGELVNYSMEEWESILSRLANSQSNKFDFEQYRNQFLTSTMDYINLGGFELNPNPLMFPAFLPPYLLQQMESQMEFVAKSQFLMGNVCVIDPNSGMPSASNITTKGLPKGSPNAMLAYASLVNRLLFAKPSLAKDVAKQYKLPLSIFSDPRALCEAFAPDLLPKTNARNNR